MNIVFTVILIWAYADGVALLQSFPDVEFKSYAACGVFAADVAQKAAGMADKDVTSVAGRCAQVTHTATEM